MDVKLVFDFLLLKKKLEDHIQLKTYVPDESQESKHPLNKKNISPGNQLRQGNKNVFKAMEVIIPTVCLTF